MHACVHCHMINSNVNLRHMQGLRRSKCNNKLQAPCRPPPPPPPDSERTTPDNFLSTFPKCFENCRFECCKLLCWPTRQRGQHGARTVNNQSTSSSTGKKKRACSLHPERLRRHSVNLPRGSQLGEGGRPWSTTRRGEHPARTHTRRREKCPRVLTHSYSPDNHAHTATLARSYTASMLTTPPLLLLLCRCCYTGELRPVLCAPSPAHWAHNKTHWHGEVPRTHCFPPYLRVNK